MLLFAAAWMIGFVGVRPSLVYTYCVAIFSYLFWAFSACGLMVLKLLQPFTYFADGYVPPPLALIVSPHAEIRANVLASVLHLVATAMTNTLITYAIWSLRRRARRFIVAGAFLGAAASTMVMLPPEALPSSVVLGAALRYATLRVSMIYRLANVAVPVASNRLEMSYPHLALSVGCYVLIVALVFSLLSLAAEVTSSRRRWD
jgi:hypothetical protein